MKTLSRKHYILISVLLCAIAMSLVDGVIQPGYAVKSAIKVVLFLLVPIGYFLWTGSAKQLKALFVPKRRDFLIALAVGVGVYVLILGGYFLINSIYDITELVLDLTGQSGVSAENFLWVSLYISFVNSLLEEFMFRGFAFLSLKRHTSRRFAYLFSALVFAGYHFGMISGNANPAVWALTLLGLTAAGVVLNFLNEKSGSILNTWLVHMFANFAINTVGFIIFGMI